VSKSTIRKYFYKFSRPCVVGVECPHDRDPDECEARASVDTASQCPSARPPYAARHGYITELRKRGVPAEVIAERVDTSVKWLLENYDETDLEEQRRLRQKLLEEVRDEDNYGYL
jgi:hypothetical protein